MSAIAAIFHRNGAPLEQAGLQAMLAATPDRTVDGQSLWHSGPMGLGHQHFWLTPEEHGEDQPLLDGSSRYAITCHVRLDNRPELMRLLELSSPEDRLVSDAQLILLAYRKWGVDCPKYLLGDFALVIWDGVLQQLFIARDQMGAGDICYFLDSKICLVASQVSQIIAHPAVEPRINEGRVAELLAKIWNNHLETYFEGIFYLPPAHCAVITATHERVWRYWDIDPGKKIHYRSEEQYAQHYYGLLEEAVQCRLRTRGEVGLSLSGGLDSASLAVIATPLLSADSSSSRRLKSFSYVFDRFTQCDERAFFQPLVERYGIQSHCIPSDEKWSLRHLERWPAYRDFPVLDAYAWLPLSVLEAAKGAGCRLLLSGMFGDSLYSGTQFWFAETLYEFRLGELIQFISRERPHLNWRRDFWTYGFRQLAPLSLKLAYRKVFRRVEAFRHPGLHPTLIERTDLAGRRRRTSPEPYFSTPGRAERYHSIFNGYIAESIAATRHIASPYHIEYAYPFYDQRVVEFIMAVPASQLGRPSQTRPILRNALNDRLPEKIRARSGKTEFTPLFTLGVLNVEKQVVRTLLQNPQIVARKYIQADWLGKELVAGENWSDGGLNLWMCIALELWLRRYWS